MNIPKISVIVPIYRTEQYLQKCLDSIVHQTYPNLEIILVDDGSPDDCGTICDTYAAQDARIEVIHKPNGGVSSARNAGLAVAKGEWIGWVDSDDWIEPEMYEYLLKKAQTYGADIAACGQAEHWKSRVFLRTWEREQAVNTEEAMELLLKNDRMQSSLCDKLWRRELFEGIVFPEGRTYEDMAVMHRLFARAERVVCLPGAMYHYVQHPESIISGGTLESRINHYRASRQRLEEMGGQWPQYRHLLEAQCVASAITIWCGYYSSSKAEQRDSRPELEEIAAFAREHYRLALDDLHLGLLGRMVVRLTPYPAWWSFALAGLLGWAYEQKHGRRP